MRKILLLGALLSAFAMADTVGFACVPYAVLAGSGSGNIGCPGYTAPGLGGVINSVSVYATPDYSNGLLTGSAVRFNFTAPLGWTLVTSQVIVTGTTSSTGVSEYLIATFAPAAQSVGGSLTGITSTVTLGSVLTASSAGRVVYDYTPGVATVPEPSSIILTACGVALFGVHRLRRRNRS
jgi:hypothetical protein